jgi:hypothetical protein
VALAEDDRKAASGPIAWADRNLVLTPNDRPPRRFCAVKALKESAKLLFFTLRKLVEPSCHVYSEGAAAERKSSVSAVPWPLNDRTVPERFQGMADTLQLN